MASLSNTFFTSTGLDPIAKTDVYKINSATNNSINILPPEWNNYIKKQIPPNSQGNGIKSSLSSLGNVINTAKSTINNIRSTITAVQSTAREVVNDAIAVVNSVESTVKDTVTAIENTVNAGVEIVSEAITDSTTRYLRDMAPGTYDSLRAQALHGFDVGIATAQSMPGGKGVDLKYVPVLRKLLGAKDIPMSVNYTGVNKAITDEVFSISNKLKLNLTSALDNTSLANTPTYKQSLSQAMPGAILHGNKSLVDSISEKLGVSSIAANVHAPNGVSTQQIAKSNSFTDAVDIMNKIRPGWSTKSEVDMTWVATQADDITDKMLQHPNFGPLLKSMSAHGNYKVT